MSDDRNRWSRLFGGRGTNAAAKSIRITSAVFWNLLLILVVFGLIGAAFAGGTAAGYFASLVQDEPVRGAEELEAAVYDYEESTEIYFADEVYLGDMPSPLERREIPLEEVSQNVIDAVIATEDEYFFEHEGIVPKALMRAVMQDFSNAATQTGGSTLTQQLVKNQVLSSEVTHDRKATEILLAMRLEHFFEKEDILEAYLNIVPFGRNASGQQIAGVQAAAQGIFDVDAAELTIPQAAFIAGLPQSPFAYTPFNGNGEQKESLEAGLNRMETVLDRMHRHGYITEQEFENALNYDITADFAQAESSSYEDYPFILSTVENRARDRVAEHLMAQDGVNPDEMEDPDYRLLMLNRYREQAEQELQRNGYRIHTTINKDIYDAQQEAVRNFENFGPDKTVADENDEGEIVEINYQEEVGSVLMDNRTGAVISFVAGRDFEENQNNHAMSLSYASGFQRSSGSTMKPLLTFAVGFETGVLQPGFITPDTPYSYPGDDGEEVNNFDRSYRGMITAREALALSRNVPAVREFEDVDHDTARQALINYGFERYFPDDDASFPYPGSPLGTLGMTVEANTSAYTTFGNNGSRKEAFIIDRIETSEGDVIYETDTEVETEILSPQTNYLMIDVMRDVLTPGLGTAGSLPDRLNFSTDLAGKTGTTNEIKDSWFVGVNPNFTQGIWVGYDAFNLEIEQQWNGLGYGPRTQSLWADLANAAHSVDPQFMAPEEGFARPDGIVEQSVCGISGMLPSDLCREAGLVTTDLFNAEYVPTESDDSLERVQYVRVNGSNYEALSSTPSEFTRSGVSVKEEYFDFDEDGDISEYIPDDWDNLVNTEDTAPDNGRTPGAPPSVFGGSSSMGWGAHPEGDVVGYRVYRSATSGGSYSLVDSVRWDQDYRASAGTGYYYVTAVDVAGRESSPSSTVTIGSPGSSSGSSSSGGSSSDSGSSSGSSGSGAGSASGSGSTGGSSNTDSSAGGGNGGGSSGANNSGSNSGGNSGANNGGSNDGSSSGANNGGSNNGSSSGANNGGSNSGGNSGANNGGSNSGGNSGANNGGSNSGGNSGANNGGSNSGGNSGANNSGSNGGGNSGANDGNADAAGNNNTENEE
ncbi:transglycosylase domain-containing protein [Alkalicoccus urumqiensis]|uniref:Penicillin-binding protein n=1 Tax=Alkalicoccus urumqiensis TaxID=1548213 RepID=A0A2P6MGK4_ALKUR|nr:transglycosylase domain-containing protein [Alkalicoccus urumqiensis]PRO65416.1 penicillin-binding protein [Alkalicoccus urumqiensis]